MKCLFPARNVAVENSPIHFVIFMLYLFLKFSGLFLVDWHFIFTCLIWSPCDFLEFYTSWGIWGHICFFWVLVLGPHAKRAEHKQDSLRTHLPGGLPHLWKLGTVLAVLTSAFMGLNKSYFVQQLQILVFYYKTILSQNHGWCNEAWWVYGAYTHIA